MSSVGKIPLRGSGSAVDGSRRCPHCGSPGVGSMARFGAKGFIILLADRARTLMNLAALCMEKAARRQEKIVTAAIVHMITMEQSA